MSTRLKVRLAILCIGLVVYGIIRLVNPSRVTFFPANMSINPGKGWKAVEIPASPPVCSPRLINASGMINALLLDEELTEVKAAAEKMKANLVAAGKATAEAFKQEEFVTASGLAGIHFSYTGKSSKSDSPDVRSHHFITRNMHNRCVSISYITSPELESPTLVAAITKTLRVE
ncbi:MAG TPA: hypothetical protein VLT36_12680 [Candidatus Dormibacteraeota bacterium]|nr:hypothetical protein [Candidatus Dormibacteraeota bacterium]